MGIGFRPPPHTWLGRSSRAIGIGGYVSAVAVAAAVILASPLFALAAVGLHGAWLSLLAGLGAIPAIDAAVALVNRGVTRSFGATLLPALALRDGVPSHLRTLVAVPTLLTTHESIEEQIERLEIHHLASPEGNLHFALLSDWVDAMTEHFESDAALLAAAAEGIARLNQRHGAVPGGDRFLLLHRRRVWNEGEGCWIGWERKRGKLHELNQLLRGATDTTFVSTTQQPCVVPADVRYVITLDADTKLPRDTVRRLIGKMAHPLNRPRFDADAGRVVEGYAVLQPRVTPSLPIGREGSLFQRVFSGMSGIDPYAAAVSDVYQDMFGEGSYAGKGIYEVDAFEAAVAGRVSDSTLLSHDLFEGVFARAGLASDVEVVDEFPARYDVAALRHHRWARGDWQLLPWILGRGPVASEDRKRGAIPAIGRWKMVDNLRRTLSAPAAVLALLAGWTLPFEAAAIWTFFVLATIVLPTLIPVVAAVIPGRTGITVRSHLGALGADLRLALAQSALMISFLAHQAWLMARRDRANPDPAVRYPAASARVGYGRAGSDRSEARPFRLLSPDGRGDHHRRCGGDRRFGVGARDLAARVAVRGALDRLAGDRPLDEPISCRGGQALSVPWRRPGPATDRPADLAVLRDLRDAGRSDAAAGQFPGRSGAGVGA